MSKIRSRILELRNLVTEHNHNYYDLDKNLISDFEYDKLINELIKLENQYPEFHDENSPSKRVGGGLSDKFDSESHIFQCFLSIILTQILSLKHGIKELLRLLM